MSLAARDNAELAHPDRTSLAVGIDHAAGCVANLNRDPNGGTRRGKCVPGRKCLSNNRPVSRSRRRGGRDESDDDHDEQDDQRNGESPLDDPEHAWRISALTRRILRRCS